MKFPLIWSGRIFLLLILPFLVGSCISFSHFDSGKLIPSSAEPTQIDFEFVKDLIVLEAEVNGARGRFLFDNGFSLSAIDREFAAKIGLEPKNSRNVTDANNKQASIPEAKIASIRIADQTFEGTYAYILDTKLFFPCNSIDGIIGASVINKINWDMDMQAQSMRLSSTPFQESGTTLDVSFSSNNSTFVSLTVEGVALKTKIDFGKNTEMDIRYDLVRKALSGRNAEKTIGIMSLSATGLGAVDTSFQMADRLTLAHNVQTLPTGADAELSHELKYPAYLGALWFRPYRVVINSSTEEYILMDPAAQPDSSESTYGIALYQVDDSWRVIQMNPAAPWADKVALMDEVISLDGEPINRFETVCEYRAYLLEKAGRQESLSLQLASSPADTLIFPYEEPAWTRLP